MHFNVKQQNRVKLNKKKRFRVEREQSMIMKMKNHSFTVFYIVVSFLTALVDYSSPRKRRKTVEATSIKTHGTIIDRPKTNIKRMNMKTTTTKWEQSHRSQRT